MKRSDYNKLLRNWILVLLCCTLTGIMLDILFSGPDNRQEISSHIQSNNPEENPSKSAFDSIRNMYLINRDLNSDSITNL